MRRIDHFRSCWMFWNARKKKYDNASHIQQCNFGAPAWSKIWLESVTYENKTGDCLSLSIFFTQCHAERTLWKSEIKTKHGFHAVGGFTKIVGVINATPKYVCLPLIRNEAFQFNLLCTFLHLQCSPKCSVVKTICTSSNAEPSFK